VSTTPSTTTTSTTRRRTCKIPKWKILSSFSRLI
jgi:hypothetical protein